MTQWGSCCSIFSFLCSVLQIIVQLFLSFGHCIVVPSSIYGLVRFVLLDLQFSVQCFVDHCLSYCPFPLPLYCRSFFNLWLSGVRVARSLVFCVVFCRSLFVLLSLSFGHCIVVPSSIYGLVGFVLLDLQFSVQCFVDHCLSYCPFLLAIVLSFLLQSMTQWGSCCSIFSFLCSVLQIIVCLVVPFFWPLYCRSFFNLWLSWVRVARSLVFCVVFCRSLFVLLSLSFGHCIVVPSSIYDLVGFVLLDLYVFFCVVFCRSLFVLLSLSLGDCIVVPSSIYGLVGFVLLELQFSVQCFVDHWPLYCRSFFNLWLSGVRVARSLVFFWPLYCRSFFNLWLIGVCVFRSQFSVQCFVDHCPVLLSLSFGHCIVVPSSIYGLVGFVLFLLQFMTQWGSCFSLVFCVVFCRSLFVLLSLSFGHCIVVPSSIYDLVGFVLLDLQFSVQCFVDHCLSCCPFLLAIVLSFLLQSMAQWGSCCSIFSFLCSVLQIIVCLVVPFFWPLYCRSFFNLWLSGVRVARSLVFCVVFCRSLLSCCPFLLAIVLLFLRQSMAQWGSCCSIFSFLCSVLQIIVCLVVPFFWPLYCRSFFNLWLSGVRVARSLIFCIVFCRSLFILFSLSFDHCIVVPSSIYDLAGFVLLDLQFSVQCFVDHCMSCCPFLLAIILSFLLQSMAQWGSCCSIFSLLCSVLQIIVCVFFPFLFHCIVFPSSIYGLVGFVLLDLQFSVQCFVDHCLSCCPFLLTIVLSVLPQSMAQWGSCCQIFSFLCSVLQIIVLYLLTCYIICPSTYGF